MIASRIFTVLACAALVAAFALASLLPPDLPLGQALLDLDARSLIGLRDDLGAHGFAWADLVAPVLARPVWVPPAMIGIVFAGLAISFRPRTAAPTRRRS